MISKKQFFYGIFLFLILTMNNALSESPTEIPIDDFFENNTDFQHRLSPNGKYLAFIRWYPNGYTLGVTDLDEAELVHETVIAKSYPRNLQWLSDRRLTFNMSGNIIAINLDGTDKRNLVNNVYGDDAVINGYYSYKKHYRHWVVSNALLKEPELILVRSRNLRGYQSIHRINIFTGEKEDLYDGDKYKIHYWMIDQNGAVRLAIRANRDKSTYYRFDSSSKKLKKIDPKVNKLNFDFEGKTFLSNRAIPIGTGTDQDSIYVIENQTGDKFRVISYNFVTGESTEVLSDLKYDVGDAEDEPRMLYDPISAQLVGIQYNQAKPRFYWLDDELSEIQARINARYPNSHNQILEWTDDRSRVLFRSSSEKFYGVTTVYSPGDKRMLKQSLGAPSISQDKLATTEVINYQTLDKGQIEAYLTLPEQKENSKGLVVYPHGGPFLRTTFGYDPYTQYFASRGYAVIEPNFRGSTGYGRKHLMHGKGSIHDAMISDIKQSADWAISQGIANSDQVFIFGFSYGGYAAVMSAIKYPDFYRAAISYAAPLDINAQLQHYRKKELHHAFEYWNEMILKQKKSRKLLRALSPQYQLDEISIPTLIFHGDKDRIVPYSHAEAFKKSLKKQPNSMVKVYKLKDEGHSIRLKSNKIYFTEKAETLFNSTRHQ